MAGIISNPPKGLYSLLGLQDMGAVPRVLADSVAGTIDLTQFLLLNRESVFSPLLPSFGVVGWVGVTGGITVPAGELWYVHEVYAEATMGAGIAGRIAIGYAERTNVPTVVGNSNAAAAGEIAASHRTEDPFWAIPGSSFPVLVQANTGGSFNTAVYAIVTRLRI